MKRDCEICRGAGLIRLPLYRHAAVNYGQDGPVSIEESSRTYPCPECANTIPQERLAVLQSHTLVDSRINDPRFAQHVKSGAAHMLVDELLKNGFITFARGPDDNGQMAYPMVATIGVVSPKHVANLEDRIAERQAIIATELADEAVKQISNWGSFYSGPDYGIITKSRAIELVRQGGAGRIIITP